MRKCKGECYTKALESERRGSWCSTWHAAVGSTCNACDGPKFSLQVRQRKNPGMPLPVSVGNTEIEGNSLTYYKAALTIRQLLLSSSYPCCHYHHHSTIKCHHRISPEIIPWGRNIKSHITLIVRNILDFSHAATTSATTRKALAYLLFLSVCMCIYILKALFKIAREEKAFLKAQITQRNNWMDCNLSK